MVYRCDHGTRSVVCDVQVQDAARRVIERVILNDFEFARHAAAAVGDDFAHSALSILRLESHRSRHADTGW